MYQLLHLFNKSSALGLAAVEQFNLPRRGTWSRIGRRPGWGQEPPRLWVDRGESSV